MAGVPVLWGRPWAVMSTCPDCGSRTTAPNCNRQRSYCRSYCAGCTIEITASPIEGYPNDLLMCNVCGHGDVVHAGLRKPCWLCETGGPKRDRERYQRWMQLDHGSPGFTVVGFLDCLTPARQRRQEYETGWGNESVWYRHDQCGNINPRGRFPNVNRGGMEAPPYCPDCDGPDWEPDDRRIPADAPDLLYLVGFPGFIKVGRTLEPGPRLHSHLALVGARLIQVVGGRHDRVAAAEATIKRTFASSLLTEPHAYMSHFGLKETFRPAARRRIGDLRPWVGRGARDRTADFVAR